MELWGYEIENIWIAHLKGVNNEDIHKVKYLRDEMKALCDYHKQGKFRNEVKEPFRFGVY